MDTVLHSDANGNTPLPEHAPETSGGELSHADPIEQINIKIRSLGKEAAVLFVDGDRDGATAIFHEIEALVARRVAIYERRAA